MPGSEGLVGKEIDNNDESALSDKSKLPLRFWHWSPIETEAISRKKATQKIKGGESQESTRTQEAQPPSDWKPTAVLDMTAIGIREARSNSDLQGFRLIKGYGPVAANLATLRMLARAYNTPCPIDVLEKALEGAAERAGSIPIHGMGQLAEAMGLQTQVVK